jgi:hypothetical protein
MIIIYNIASIHKAWVSDHETKSFSVDLILHYDYYLHHRQYA